MTTKHISRTRKRRHYLYREFAHFYENERCRWAPINPRRVFGMAFKSLYPVYRTRLTPQEFLGLIYAVLGVRHGKPGGLFQTFDPQKYNGRLPLEEHFLNHFMKRLRGAVRNSFRRTRTDQNRPGDRARFTPRPGLGLYTADRTYRCDYEVEDALEMLDAEQKRVIQLLYWHGLSCRATARSLGMDHKTVARKHDAALGKLRRLYVA